ncbi:Transposable element Hobo transposase [Frankliniella fusca]|uniref:Transposable element Hobo transposase n=1 Tax=Frankliniella fusca TaxID=407009 RepID=A0AAE1LMQ1_9NEOP|nr:Transposable element Hobo transposase [Frankliniella fusca]
MAEVASGDSDTEASDQTEEVLRKLKTGEYELEEDSPRKKSEMWLVFKTVIDSKSKKSAGYIYCQECKKVQAYNHKKGTSTAKKHGCVKKATRNQGAAGRNVGGGGGPLVPLIAPTQAAKKQVLRSSVLYCAKDLAPFQSVQGEGFLDLVQNILDIGFQATGRVDARRLMPDRTTVSRNMEDMAGEIKLKFIPLVKEAIRNNTCAATTDMWTQENNRHHFFTVILHITSSEGKNETRTAFTVLFDEETASAENIWSLIVTQFALLDIEEEEVRKIVFVSDRGANLVSALKDVVRLNCIAHIINTVLKTALTLKKYEVKVLNDEATEIVDKVKQILSYLNSKLPKNIKQFEITKTARAGATQPSYAPMLAGFVNRHKEVQRRLQKARAAKELSFDDSFVGAVKDLYSILYPLKNLMTRHKDVDLPGSLWPEFQSQWREQLLPLEYSFVHQKCKALVTFVKTSNINHAFKTTLKQEMDVRWNTSLTMFQSILSVYDELSTALAARNESVKISHIKRDTLENLIALLEPFKAESVKLQSESEPTLQHVLMSRATLMDHCKSPTPPAQPLIERLKSRIVTQMERIFVHSEIRRLCLQQPADAPPPSPPKRAKVSECYLKYLEDEYDQWDVDDEFDLYLKSPIIDDSNLIGWWRQRRERFPRLSALALHLLNIPATSASSEREFSEAGHIYREKRLSLHPTTASDVLFINSNSGLLEV